MFSAAVGKLKKATYLVQADRCWYNKFNNELKTLGFEPPYPESCAYSWILDGKLEILVVAYMDDLLITSKEKEAMVQIVAEVKSRNRIQDLREVSYYMGCHITHASPSKPCGKPHSRFGKDLIF